MRLTPVPPDAALLALIVKSHGQSEADRYASYVPTDDDFRNALNVGLEVLRRTSPRPGSCAHLNALWTAILRDHPRLPAHCVAGDLRARGKLAFGGSAQGFERPFEASNGAWDGHCWMVLGDRIGDLSIFLTAYSLPPASNLRATVLQQFGPGRELLFERMDGVLEAGLEYVPRHVVTDEQITALVQGVDVTEQE